MSVCIGHAIARTHDGHADVNHQWTISFVPASAVLVHTARLDTDTGDVSRSSGDNRLHVSLCTDRYSFRREKTSSNLRSIVRGISATRTRGHPVLVIEDQTELSDPLSLVIQADCLFVFLRE